MSSKTKSQLEAELQEARAQIVRLEQALQEARDSHPQKPDGRGQPQSELDETFRWFLNFLPVGVSVLNTENKVIFSNHVLEEILEITDGELARGSYRSRRYLAADGSPMPPDGFASAQAARSGQPVYNVDTGIIKENGETIWTSVSALPVHFADWKTVIVSSDITQRKRAEEALKLSEGKYSALFEKSAVPAALTKMPEVTFADVNEAFQAAFGYSREDVVGKTSLEIGMALPAERAETSAGIERYGMVRDNEKHLFTKTGELRIGAINASKVVIDGQDFVITTIHDVTGRKLAEAKLAESESRFATIFENSPVALGISNLSDGKISDVNTAFVDLYGYTREEVIGRTTVELGIWATPADRQQFIDRLERDGSVRNLELVARLKSGGERNVLVSGEKVEINGRPCLVAQIQDISERKRLEESLRESQEKYTLLFEKSTVPTVLLKLPGVVIVDVNEACEKLTGYRRDEMCGRTAVELGLGSQEERAEVISRFERQGSLVGNETHLLTRTGEKRIVVANTMPVKMGGQMFAITTMQDITERKHAEQELILQSEILREKTELLEHAHVLVRDLDNQIVMWSQGMEKLYGWTKEEALGQVTHTFLQTEFPVSLDAYQAELMESGHWQGELTHTRKDGARIAVASDHVLYRDPNGKPYLILEVNNDITKLKLAETELERSRENFFRAFHSNPAALAITRAVDGKFILVNEAYTSFMGYEPDETLGRTVQELNIYVNPEERNGLLSRLRSQGRVRNHELLVRSKAGWLRSLIVSMEQIQYSDETCILSTFIDITERKLMELRLAENERKYRELVHNANSAILRWKSDGTITFFNEYAQSLFGYRSGDIIGKSVSILVPDVDSAGGDLSTLVQSIVDHPEQSINVVNENVCRDGRRVWMAWTNKPVYDERGQLSEILAVGIDISQRKRSEEARAGLAERLDLATRSARMGIWDWDIQKNEIAWDDQMYALYGLNPGEFGGAYEAWLHGVHPEDREISNEASAAAVRGERDYDTEFRVLWPDGSVHWLKADGQVFRDKDRNPVRMVGINYDISERKQAEQELRRSNAELEQFAYIASHDLQEPLRALTGMVQLLQKRYQGKLDERADEYIAHAVEAAGRMQALIQALLSYSRVDRRAQRVEAVAAGDCLQTALKNLDIAIRENQAVITADELPVVTADPTQLVQLFQNLVGNSIKFHGEQVPQIHISVSRSKDAWQFSVHDNGIGIEPQYFERIFVIFQRLHTRRDYAGTGIGLALCKKIVERHGGSIWVESSPGEGATFYFTLPIRNTHYAEQTSQAH